MMQKWVKTSLLLLIAVSLLAQGAMAAEGKRTARRSGKYKQVTGEVVSIAQDAVVIKSKTKGTMTLAITKNTDMIGQPVKAGDRAQVRYRADQDGNTATRITAKPARAKRSKKRSSVASPMAGLR